MLLFLADAATDGSSAAAGGVVLLAILLLVFGFYWIPTIIALSRHTANKWTVLVINLFLGWTFIGWVVALAMSFGTDQSPVTVVNVGPGYQSARFPMTASAAAPQMSPDGMHYWDGNAWRPAAGSQT